jgi:hypothetical protein
MVTAQSTDPPARSGRPFLALSPEAADCLRCCCCCCCCWMQVMVYGDCAVNVSPTSKDLASIAACSADTAAAFGIEPRVAMLSYSTMGSGAGPDVRTASYSPNQAGGRGVEKLGCAGACAAAMSSHAVILHHGAGAGPVESLHPKNLVGRGRGAQSWVWRGMRCTAAQYLGR